MAFEEEKILLKSNLCTQESFIVWCRSRFLLYNVIKELNCKDLLSFYLLGVLHSLHITPDANSFGAVEGQKPKVGSVAGKSGFVWNFISSQDFRGSSWQLCPFLQAP